MKPSNAIRGKEGAIKRLVESYGFVSPQLFGSTVRGDDQEGSDLDILATIPSSKTGRISLFDIAALEDELQVPAWDRKRAGRAQVRGRSGEHAGDYLGVQQGVMRQFLSIIDRGQSGGVGQG
ncbi:nucleotidyltransferase family protein [Pseudomonas sp. NBRC 111128]|uniref:nucleotidyltransferase family protein n=1 Tax=Pseudomonas sp. NBRC 111128 TaxID=1661043 RepID=UPI000B135BD5|nr:nucleotidyltransferase domain-containing protein [Pseudomonas sp. NBRC 111128]